MTQRPNTMDLDAAREAFRTFEAAPESIMQLPELELAICHAMWANGYDGSAGSPCVRPGDACGAVANMIRQAYEAGLDGRAAPIHPDLLPCPFCGDQPVVTPDGGGIIIACRNFNCGPTLMVRACSADLAAIAWNTRKGEA